MGSKNRLFSRIIRQFNNDLTIKTASLETEARVTTSTISTQVDSAVAQLVSTAPATLDTLDELAAALGDDANFATTVTNSLATKASIAYVDSAVGAIQGFSGSYDDLTNVPFQLDSTINSIFFDSSTPNGMLVGDLWYSSSNSKVYKAVSNPNNATVDNTQVSSPSDIIFPSPGGTSVFVTNGSAGDRNVVFNTPITIAAFYGILDDMEIKSVTFEDDTVVSGTDLGQNVRSRFYGVVSWQIVGGIFNEGKKVKSILFRRNSDANGFSFNLVAAGAPLWQEIDPGYSTLDSAAVTGLIDSAYVSARSSGGGGGGVTTYSAIANLPSSGNSTGDLAYVTANSSLYLWKGSVWFKILTAESPNTAPFFTSQPLASYMLDKTGTPLSLEFAATDPEGVPLNWSYSITGGTLGNTATITNDSDGSFTITPSTNPVDQGSFTLTFTASDGVNVANSNPVRLSLLFSLDWSTATLQTTMMAPDIGAAGLYGASIGLNGDRMIVGESRYNVPGAGNTYHGRIKIYNINDLNNITEEFSFTGIDDSAGSHLVTAYSAASQGANLGGQVEIYSDIAFAKTGHPQAADAGVTVFQYDSAWSYTQFISFADDGVSANTGVMAFDYDPLSKRLAIAAGNQAVWYSYNNSTKKFDFVNSLPITTTAIDIAVKDDWSSAVTGTGDDAHLWWYDSLNGQWTEVAKFTNSVAADLNFVDIFKFNSDYFTVFTTTPSSGATTKFAKIDTASKAWPTSFTALSGGGMDGSWSGGNIDVSGHISTVYGVKQHVAKYVDDDRLWGIVGNASAASQYLRVASHAYNGNTLTSTGYSSADAISWPTHNPISFGSSIAWDPTTGILATGSPEEETNDGRVYIYRV